MKVPAKLMLWVVVAACVFSTARTARAAEPKAEVGAALASVMAGLGDNDVTIFGVPSGELSFVNPEVYLSIFIGPYFAVEPQVGLQVVSSGGHTEHVVNLTGQVDYFLIGVERSSFYFFGNAGVLDSSGSSVNPKSYSGGAGYRVPVGDSLAFRFDAHVTHFTEHIGNAVFVTVSIGGVFGSR